MVQLRGGLRKLFGRSWVASGVGGKVLGVWVGISMRFSPSQKEPEEVISPIR